MARVLIDRSETGSHPVPLATESLTAYRLVDDRSPLGVIRVAPTGSKASPNVRYAFNGDRICASQLTDIMCHKAAVSNRSKPTLYSITSSARASSGRGMVTPSALAVLRLMTISTLTACWTGRSPGWVPWRILPA